EDGIRDLIVTGVQTCALPIYVAAAASPNQWSPRAFSPADPPHQSCFHLSPAFRHRNFRKSAHTQIARPSKPSLRDRSLQPLLSRSEERRVGKECRCRWT